jgi:hypothetical protein
MLLSGLAVAGVFHGCGDSIGPPAPAAIERVVTGDLTTITGATALIAVRVTDAGGRPLANIAVDWSVAAGAGSVEPAQSRTDAAGEARTVWTVGTTPGSQQLHAAVAGLAPHAITALVEPGPPSSLEPHTPPPATSVVAAGVDPAPAVVVRDAHGNPVPGVAVSFVAAGGGGSVSAAQQATDAQGVASVGWTLGTTAMVNTLTASTPGLNPLVFTVRATPAAPATLTPVAGDAELAIVATATQTPPAVRVEDEYGNAVPDVAVEFVVTAGGGSVAGARAVSDADGIATAEAWTLGPAVGPNTLVALLDGLEPAVFNAAGRPVPAIVVVSDGDGQSAPAGTPVAVAPAVIVRDAAGDPVVHAIVHFAVTAGGGSIASAQQTTGSDGIARAGVWTLGGIGENALTATVDGLPPATFTAQALDPAESFELSIDAVHLNQGSQTLHGTIGGVAGRPGLFRVVVRANLANSFAPPIRVRLYHGTVLHREQMVQAPIVGVPVEPDLADASQTWNMVLAAEDVVPGLAVEVVVDPADEIGVVTPDAKRFPRGAGTASLDVATLHPLRVVFIPIRAVVQDRTGNVTTGNMTQFLTATRQWIPGAAIEPRLAATFTTFVDLSVEENWPVLLGELQAKRTAEGARDEYYHGIVPAFADMPWGGYAYRTGSPGSGFRTGVSHDQLPGAAVTVAHELGHNMGRRHAPCGNPLGPDANFPHADAMIGSPGFDIASSVLVPTDRRDYMSYCSPRWTSDYTYDAIVRWRRQDPLAVPASGGYSLAAAPTSGGYRATAAAPTTGVLVWGRVHGGGVELNPAFSLTATPALPLAPGPNTLRGADADGRQLFSLSFEGVQPDHSSDPQERHFAFFVPLTAQDAEALATLEVVTRAGTVTRRAAPLAAGAAAAARAAPEVQVERLPGDQLRLRWDATSQPMALVRDARTGEVLAFARDGEGLLRDVGRDPNDVEIMISDGVRSRVATPTRR